MIPPEQLATDPFAVVPTPGNAGSPASGPVMRSAGDAPVTRRLYGDGLTTSNTPSPLRLTWTTALPTDSCSIATCSAVLAFGSVCPCWKYGLGYSWLTKSRPSSEPRSGKYARKSLLKPYVYAVPSSLANASPHSMSTSAR